MYKTRFRRWGLWKHNQASNVVEIVRLKKQRDAAHKSSEFILNGRRVDLDRIESYLRRNEKMRRYVATVAAGGSDSETSPTPPTAAAAVAAARASALICRTPTPESADSFELQNEEMMYRAIRDYYDGAFSSQRWAFKGDARRGSPDEDPAVRLAIERTEANILSGQEVWLRFRTAFNLLERPATDNNGGKEGDYAQGVRLMRIAFAELSQNIISGCESPLLLFWMMHVMTIFRESELRDFRPVEWQLLKHLYDLTSSTPGGSRHATAFLWRILWSGGRGIARDRYHLRMCTAVAIEQFTRHIGYFHQWTVDLLNFSIFTFHPNGTGDPEDKTTRFRDLLHQLETLDIYDNRHLDVVCCWASHYRHHGSRDVNPEMLEEGVALLEDVLHDPQKARAVEDYPGSGFNVYSLLTSLNCRLKRWEVAEGYVRSAIEVAKLEMERTGEDGDMFEGLNGLEAVLRAQGKIAEADAVQEERKRLVKESLEKVGEKEDSA